MTANPDRPWPHENFAATVGVHRLTAADGATVEGYMADVRVECIGCAEPFRWIGLRAGVFPDRPGVSIDETELRAPLRPASADPDFGLGIPGIAVQVREGPRR